MTERYISKATPVTPYEREILQILAEECNEVAAAVSKILRFGKDDRHPRPDVNKLTAEVVSLIQKARPTGKIEEGEYIAVEAAVIITVGELSPPLSETNSVVLGLEIGDLLHMIDRVQSEGLVNYDDVVRGQTRKYAKLARYMQTEKPK